MEKVCNIIILLCICCGELFASNTAPQLSISQPAKGEVLLRYLTPKLGVMDAIEITLPKDFKVSKNNIFVNVIGRGEVSIANLKRQSVGRVGSKSDRQNVGSSQIINNVSSTN